MSIILYDLAGADPDLRFSPYCWRTRFALAHKDLPVETVPWRFTETDAIAFSGQGKVPVIRDGETVVSDSWSIAAYLEDQYPGAALFGGTTGRAHAQFVNAWADGVLVGGIVRFILRDLFDIIDPKDRAYFRSSRESRFGTTLEAIQEGREDRLAAFRDLLGVDTPGAAAAGLAGRRRAKLCGPHRRRDADVAALRQPVRIAGERRHRREVAGPRAGSVRRPGPGRETRLTGKGASRTAPAGP